MPKPTISALTLAKQGLSKSKVLSMLTNEWDLTTSQQKLLDIHEYYVRRWEASYIRNIIRDGLITHETVTYAVIYRSCTPASLRLAAEVKCSFRASGNGNFVLIQPITNSKEL